MNINSISPVDSGIPTQSSTRGSHIAGVSLPPMKLPKAPPEKIGNDEGFLTTMVLWESPEQAVTDCANKKI